MTYSELIVETGRQVEALRPRHKAAFFWLLGGGLLSRLDASRSWAEWFAAARRLGYDFVLTGERSDEMRAVWESAQEPTGEDSSQLLNSAVVCASTPLGIALDPDSAVGDWWEHALFPVLQSESLRLFGDVALPDDDEDLDAVLDTPRMQSAVEYCRGALARLATAESAPDASLIEELLPGAEALAPT